MFDKGLNELDFDCFLCRDISSNQHLSYLMLYLFYKNDLFEELNIDAPKFLKFIRKIQDGYFSSIF